MNWLAKPLLALSGLGVVLSAAVHVASLLDVDLNLGERVFALHIGAILVCFPTALLAWKFSRARRGPSGLFAGNRQLHALLAGCPRWMVYTLYALFAYALVNFFVAMDAVEPGAKVVGVPPSMLRGFSGHWLVFYYANFAVAWSVLRRPDLLQNAHCPQGHRVAHEDAFCAQCGSAIPARKTT